VAQRNIIRTVTFIKRGQSSFFSFLLDLESGPDKIYLCLERSELNTQNAFYHTMARGDRGEPIFQGDEDRELFLKTLEEAVQRTGWIIHAYVLMTNLYHFLMETPEPNLVLGMKWFQGTYTQRYDGLHRLRGHVYQGRYKAIVIDSDEMEFVDRVGTYIHLNPVRAGLVRPETVGPSILSLEQFPVFPCIQKETLLVEYRPGSSERGCETRQPVRPAEV